jgi:hypothetical protein
MCIPAPTESDKPFEIKDILTLYEAAMVYAGRHPYPHFFDVKDSSIKECREFLRLGVSEKSSRKRLRAQRSWDIYCELIRRIERGRIQPVETAYDPQGKIDLRRTRIKTSDLMCLAADRGEKPRYLRPRLLELSVATKTATQMAPIERPTRRPDMRVVEAEYEERLKSFHAQNRYPSRQEDLKWGKEKILKRDAVRELRSKFIPSEVRRGGRPKSRIPDKK